MDNYVLLVVGVFVVLTIVGVWLFREIVLWHNDKKRMGGYRK